MTTQEMIDVLQAHERGEAIEFRFLTDCNNIRHYWSVVNHPIWDFSTCEYRVKQSPPPPPREIWVNAYQDGSYGEIQLSKDDADYVAMPGRIKAVHFREVME